MDLVLVGRVAAAVLAGAAGGMASGVITRRVLWRLRRGVDVPARWCAAALGLLGAVVLGAWAAGAVPWRAVPVLLVLGWLAVAGSATDLLARRLPDALTLPAVPAVALALIPAGAQALLRAVAGALLLSAGYAAVHLGVPAALGAGDVKAAAPVGAALAGTAWPALVLGVAAIAVASALIAVAAVALGRLRYAASPPGRETALPHGPPLFGAAWVTVLAAAAALPT